MSVPLNHRQGLPTAEFLNREKVYALHGEPRGEGVSEIVEAAIVDLRDFDHLEDIFSAQCVKGLRCSETQALKNRDRTEHPPQDCSDHGGLGDVACLPVLRALDRDDTGLQIDVFPPEIRELGFP